MYTHKFFFSYVFTSLYLYAIYAGIQNTELLLFWLRVGGVGRR